MKQSLFLKLALSLAVVFFTIMIMTTWWQYLFAGVFKNQFELEKTRFMNELYQIRLEMPNSQPRLLQFLEQKKAARLENGEGCSPTECVAFLEEGRLVFYALHPQYMAELQRAQKRRINMILWETSFLIVILLLAIAYLVWGIYREKRNQAERLEFLAMTTHELKHPISTVSLVLDSLKRDSIPPERRGEFIDRALSEVKVLGRSLENLLKIQEIEIGAKKSDATVKLGECGEALKESWELHSLNNPPRIQFHFGDTRPGQNSEARKNSSAELRIDMAAFLIIANNLIENALLYSKETVEVTLDLDAGTPYLEVKDRGLGFTEEEKGGFQKLFYRSNRHTIQNIRGSGLGHYIIKGLTEKYGLRLELKSEGENKGSAFSVRFK